MPFDGISTLTPFSIRLFYSFSPPWRVPNAFPGFAKLFGSCSGISIRLSSSARVLFLRSIPQQSPATTRDSTVDRTRLTEHTPITTTTTFPELHTCLFIPIYIHAQTWPPSRRQTPAARRRGSRRAPAPHDRLPHTRVLRPRALNRRCDAVSVLVDLHAVQLHGVLRQ